MSDYVQSTNFATKDALPSGDPLKIVKGTEINTEFANIATAVATKADKSGYTANGVVYSSSGGILSTGSGFVFDGTNVGIGESTPATYGKFVVAGTGSFTNSLVSTSSTLTDRPLLEFRKTMNVTSGQANVVGRLSFNGKFGSTAGEQAYISVVSTNTAGILDANVLRLSTRSVSGGVDGAYAELKTSSAVINSGNGAEIELVNGVLNYDATTHNFYGDISSPDLTGTPTTPTAALNTNTTQIASTAFVQSALSQYIKVHTVNTTTGSSYSNGSGSYTDLLTLSITPKSASSKFFLIASASFSCTGGAGNGAEVALVRNSTTLLNQYNGHALNNTFNASFAPNIVDSPSTTSAITYRIQAKREGADTISNLGTYSFTVIEYS
jgi:hypothetical protein